MSKLQMPRNLPGIAGILTSPLNPDSYQYSRQTSCIDDLIIGFILIGFILLCYTYFTGQFPFSEQNLIQITPSSVPIQ